MDEVNSLKGELQKSKDKEESLEEELIFKYEQNENLKTIIRQLHEQIQGKEEERGQQKQNKEQKKLDINTNPKKTYDATNDKKQTTKKDKVLTKGDSNDTSWEDKVTLWKKILKGIEMDMIISSKKKACNTEIHLKFINEVENNAHQWNTLLSTFFFSTSNNVTGAYTFRNEKKKAHDEVKEEKTSINDSFPKSSGNKNYEEHNLNSASSINAAIDLIGLHDSVYHNTSSPMNIDPNATLFGGDNEPITTDNAQSHHMLPPDIFTEQIASNDNNIHDSNFINTAPMGISSNNIIPVSEVEDSNLVDLPPQPLSLPPPPPDSDEIDQNTSIENNHIITAPTDSNDIIPFPEEANLVDLPQPPSSLPPPPPDSEEIDQEKIEVKVKDAEVEEFVDL